MVGMINYDKKSNNSDNKIEFLASELLKIEPNLYKVFRDEQCSLGCHNKIYSHLGYKIVYDGRLYNKKELKSMLQEEECTFESDSDEEIILKGYIKFKEKILDLLDGMYAFVIYNSKYTFMARDRLGIKPLFYTRKNDYFLFSTKIGNLFKGKMVKPIINIQGLRELLALGPSRKPGSGIYKNIYELKPGHYLIYRHKKIKIKKYWDLKNKEYKDSFDDAVKSVRQLVKESVKKQIDTNFVALLSGGLDSSIISAISSKEKKEKLRTYSIDYEGNSLYFKSNSYQTSEDRYYIDIFKNKFGNEHTYKVITQKKLARYLKEAMIARDFPGMADIDSSLLWFSHELKKDVDVILSGEGADEIFGGYPWFYKEELQNIKGFPWMRFIEKREELVNKSIRKKLKIQKTMYREYKKTIKQTPKDKDKTKRKHKELLYLNIKWFLPTLLERKHRMTSSALIEARVPFLDHNLIEYLWNVPFEYKYYNNKEKGLLREAFKNELPEEIIDRKKNPYPKTHHPKYTKIIIQLLHKRLKRPGTQFFKIFDKEKVQELLDSKGKSFPTPWFGQLMTGPQLIAYLYQFDLWLEEYDIILDF